MDNDSLKPSKPDKRAEFDDASSVVPREETKEDKTRVTRRIESFMGMMQYGPRPDPLIEKLDSTQISQVIANAEAENIRNHALGLKEETSRRIYIGIGAGVIIGICWLFLAYDKAEHVDAVISAIVGLLGGYGLGKASSKS